MIEFALALPIFCLMLLGMIDLGRYSLQRVAMLEGARAGAEYGIFNYSDSSNINATAQNASGLTGVTATNSVFCECTTGTAVSCSTTCGSGQTLKRYITVSATKSFTSVLTTSSISFGTFGNWTAPTTLSVSMTMIVP